MERLVDSARIDKRRNDHTRHEIDRHQVQLLLRRYGNYRQLAFQVQLQRIVQRVERSGEARFRISHDLRRAHDACRDKRHGVAYELLGAELAALVQAAETNVHQFVFAHEPLARARHIRCRHVHKALQSTSPHACIGKQQHIQRAVYVHLAETPRRLVHADFRRCMHNVSYVTGKRFVFDDG